MTSKYLNINSPHLNKRRGSNYLNKRNKLKLMRTIYSKNMLIYLPHLISSNLANWVFKSLVDINRKTNLSSNKITNMIINVITILITIMITNHRRLKIEKHKKKLKWWIVMISTQKKDLVNPILIIFLNH